MEEGARKSPVPYGYETLLTTLVSSTRPIHGVLPAFLPPFPPSCLPQADGSMWLHGLDHFRRSSTYHRCLLYYDRHGLTLSRKASFVGQGEERHKISRHDASVVFSDRSTAILLSRQDMDFQGFSGISEKGIAVLEILDRIPCRDGMESFHGRTYATAAQHRCSNATRVRGDDNVAASCLDIDAPDIVYIHTPPGERHGLCSGRLRT